MKNKYFKEIVSFINFLDSLKEEDKKKIEKGELVIEYILTPKKIIPNTDRPNINDDFSEIEVINRLESMVSYDEGVSYLKSQNLKKSQLERILKKLDWSIEKKDNIARLIAKIIEATIDYRLRSQAIQGTTSSD